MPISENVAIAPQPWEKLNPEETDSQQIREQFLLLPKIFILNLNSLFFLIDVVKL